MHKVDDLYKKYFSRIQVESQIDTVIKVIKKNSGQKNLIQLLCYINMQYYFTSFQPE